MDSLEDDDEDIFLLNEQEPIKKESSKNKKGFNVEFKLIDSDSSGNKDNLSIDKKISYENDKKKSATENLEIFDQMISKFKINEREEEKNKDDEDMDLYFNYNEDDDEILKDNANIKNKHQNDKFDKPIPKKTSHSGTSAFRFLAKKKTIEEKKVINVNKNNKFDFQKKEQIEFSPMNSKMDQQTKNNKIKKLNQDNIKSVTKQLTMKKTKEKSKSDDKDKRRNKEDRSPKKKRIVDEKSHDRKSKTNKNERHSPRKDEKHNPPKKISSSKSSKDNEMMTMNASERSPTKIVFKINKSDPKKKQERKKKEEDEIEDDSLKSSFGKNPNDDYEENDREENNENIPKEVPKRTGGWIFKNKEEFSAEEEDKEGKVICYDPYCEIPYFLSKKLRDYQIQGVTFLYNLWVQNLGGILADDMGLGKTMQTVAFVTTLLRQKVETENGEIVNPKDSRKFLIISPITTLEHWKREFRQWGKNSKVKLYHGTKKNQAFSDIENGRINVLLTSYETLLTELESLNTIDWCAVILDEVHRIKNNKSKISIACSNMLCKRRYGLTGTMMQNDLEELWTLVNFAQPGSFGSLQNFKEVFIMPIKRCNRFDAIGSELAKGRKASKILREKLLRIALRRDKSIIKHLLPKKDDYIIFCPLTKFQKSVYEYVLQTPNYVMLRDSQDICSCGKCIGKTKRQCQPFQFEGIDKFLFPCLQNLNKIANHLFLLTPDTNNQKDNQEKIQNIQKFLKLSLGKSEENIKLLYQLNKENSVELSGKLKVLAQLLVKWKEKGNKVLLFSSKTRVLDILERFIRNLNYTYCRLDGNVPSEKRQGVCDTFNKNTNKFIFLISTKVGGFGLNLVSANIVVIYDPDWNASNDLQAQDRAYRLGQTRDTEIYRFITAGTIEESIYHRQLYKQQLANTTVEGNHEKRYFKGVQGVKGQEGELFGIRNLLKLETEAVMTDDIIQRTEKQYEIVKNKLQNNEGGGLMDIIFGEKEDMNDEEFIKSVRNNEQDKEQDQKKGKFSDDLKDIGVLYFHKNTDIVGDSDLEQKLSEKVMGDWEKQEIQKNALVYACNGIDPIEAMKIKEARSKKRTKKDNSSNNIGRSSPQKQKRNKVDGNTNRDSDIQMMIQNYPLSDQNYHINLVKDDNAVDHVRFNQENLENNNYNDPNNFKLMSCIDLTLDDD